MTLSTKVLSNRKPTLFSTKYFSQAVGTICTLGIIRDPETPVPAAQVSAGTTK
jgi:hypothetical protein